MTDDRPPRPTALDVRPERIADALRERDQWVCWRYEWRDGADEWTKPPIDATTGAYASSTDEDTWSSFDTAIDYHERDDRDTDGVGFVVGPGLVFGADLDDCRDPETEAFEPWAEDVQKSLDTYGEVSPSGTGLRGIGFGILPDGGNRADVDGAEGHIEAYDSARYLTVTGHHVDGTPDDVRQVNDELADVHAEYIADDEPASETANTAGNGGAEADSPDANPGVEAGETTSAGAGNDLSDEELKERAMNAKNGDKFRRLWTGDTADYDSHSEADQALCNLLTFWTGRDRSRIDDLFRQSDLYRGKWDEPHYADGRTYGEGTIESALEKVGDAYAPDGGAATDSPDVTAALDDSSDDVDADDDLEGDPTDDQDGDDESDDQRRDLLTPSEVRGRVGIDFDEGERIADLTDREKAAITWELVRESDEVHVRVRRDNGSLWAYDSGLWKPEGERALRHAARKALGPVAYGVNALAELTEQARGDPTAEIEADDLGLPSGQLAVENGLLDLDAAAAGTGDDAIRDLRPDDLAMMRLPVAFDPDAAADEWAALVDEWTENGTDEPAGDALQEYVGYCLHVGSIPIHRALLLVGSGANGKGTFLAVVRALLGDDNTTAIELQTLANERDAVADFYRSIANIDDDLSARKLGAGLGMFKKLVAGDRVRARRLYEDGFEFDAVGKHLYAANEVPKVNVPDSDEAFWRRWLLVEFPNHYPPSQRDTELRDRLTEPDRLSGVLNWAIEGRRRLLEQGYFTNEERYGGSKRERWQAWGESVDMFISECVERDPDADRISTQDAHRRYAAWCRENDEEPVGQRELTNSLKNENVDYGRHRIDGTVTRGYKALGLSDDVPALEDTPDREDPPDEQQTSFDDVDADDDRDDDQEGDDGSDAAD